MNRSQEEKALKRFALIVAALLTAGSLFAETKVTAEYGEIREGTWKFPTIAGPSRSSLARSAKITVIAGQLQKGGGEATELNNGMVGNDGEDAGQAAFFAHTCHEGGKYLMDLGAVQPIRQVNSFSFHTWDGDQGGRTPQVYTLSGSVDGMTWTKIADVDSRPNKTGEKWGNRPHGVQIADNAGKDLGSYRYLLWDMKPTNSPLTAGLQGGECWSNTFYMELDVHSAATLATSQPAKLSALWPNLQEVVVVFKTHFDIGYTHLASDAIQGYRTYMIDSALNSIDGMPPGQQFAWTLPGWPLAQILWDGQDPARRQRVEDAIRSGRLAWHALPCTVETDGLDMESLARSFAFSDTLSRKYGKALSRTGKMTDVPQHSWFLSTLLSHAGIKFLHIGTNNQCIAPDCPDFFFWEGPDGSRVLVFLSKQAYGSGLLPPKGWPFKTWFAMQMTGDNEGPPSSEGVANLLKAASARMPGVKVTLGTIDDFYNSISKEDLSKVPVVRGDMPDTWIHGIGSMPQETMLAHNIRPQLATWEMLETLLVQNKLKPFADAAKIAEAYENSLMYGEHTWGSQTEGISDDCWGDKLKQALADYKTSGKPATLVKPSLPFFEESFDQHRRYIWKTRDLAEAGLAADMKTLAENVAVKGSRAVIFNPLPWKRDAVVTVNGQPIYVKNLPPSGYKTISLKSEPSQPAGSDLTLENAYLKVTVDPARGGITSLVDKKTDRELVEQGGEPVLGQYLFEQFSANEVFSFVGDYDQLPYGTGRQRGVFRGAPITEESMLRSGQQMGKPHMPLSVQYSANYAADGTAKFERDAVSKTVTLTMPPSGKNPDPVTLRVRLYDSLPYLDLEWEIKDKTPDRIPEGGWLCFPLNLKDPSWKLGRVGAVTDPAKDIVGSNNFHLFALQSGVSVRGSDGYGVALCPLDSPLVSLGDPGLWKFSKSWTPRKPRVFVNLFNNMWNTNFPLWIDGSWRSRVRLWVLGPSGGDWDMVGPSWEARTACPVAVADGKPGQLPPEREGIKISRSGILLTAFGANPNGDGTVLRVWEQSGKSGELIVTGLHARTATPVNLRGEKTGEPLEIKDGKLVFDLNAYAPASFVIR